MQQAYTAEEIFISTASDEEATSTWGVANIEAYS